MASAYQIPFQDGSLDAAVLITVLQEIPDPGLALAKIRRVLRPGGIIAASEWLFDPDYPLRRRTARVLGEAGFTVVDGIENSGNLWTYTVKGYKQQVP